MKMTKKFDELNDEFNISNDVVETEVVKEKIEKVKDSVDDINKDYEYTRGNLYSIIEKGQEALNGILELAQESEMPRAYEVADLLIKNVADATDKLMKMQRELKGVYDESAKGPTNVTNALFVGSTADLAKLLKSESQKDNK